MLRLFGFLVLVGSVLGGFLWEEGDLGTLWQPAEVLIIFGAALGAFMIANPVTIQIMTCTHLRYVMASQTEFGRAFYMDLLVLLYKLIDTQKKHGPLAIEEHIEEPGNSDIFTLYPRITTHRRLMHFITDNFRVTGMGNISVAELGSLMEREINTLADDLKRPAKALQTTADACPGFGIIAAVMGIVVTMEAVDGPIVEIGMKVAAALVGTFLGILLCYGVIGPLADAVEHTAHDEVLAFSCIKVALTSSLTGLPSIMAVDAGRRALYSELRPTFSELEQCLRELD